MDLTWLFLLLLAIFAICFVWYRVERQRRIEDYYFDRLYWTVRQAEEDGRYYQNEECSDNYKNNKADDVNKDSKG